jgi:hypothetical protein
MIVLVLSAIIMKERMQKRMVTGNSQLVERPFLFFTVDQLALQLMLA